MAVDDELGGRLAVEHLIERGHTRVAFIGGPDTIGQVRDRLAGARRAWAEAGLPDFEVNSMFGILAPAGTPQPVIDRLNGELAAALRRPEVQAKLQEQGVVPTHTAPGAAAERIAQELDKWRTVIAEAGVKPD